MTLILYRFLCNFFSYRRRCMNRLDGAGTWFSKHIGLLRIALSPCSIRIIIIIRTVDIQQYKSIQIWQKSNKSALIPFNSLTHEQTFIYYETVTWKRTLVSLHPYSLESLVKPCFSASMRYKEMASRKHMRQT